MNHIRGRFRAPAHPFQTKIGRASSSKEKQARQFAGWVTLNKPCTYLNGSPNDYERAATISQHARKTVAHRAEFVRTAIITMCYAKREVIKQENALKTFLIAARWLG